MLRIPARSAPHPSEAAWSRVACHLAKLAEAMEALEASGGACRAAAAGRWSPSAHDRAMGQLLAVSEALEAQLGRLELRVSHYPRRRRIG